MSSLSVRIHGDEVPNAVSLFVVAALMIFSAQRGVHGSEALLITRVFEITVASALLLSFMWNALNDACSGTSYSTPVKTNQFSTKLALSARPVSF